MMVEYAGRTCFLLKNVELKDRFSSKKVTRLVQRYGV